MSNTTIEKTNYCDSCECPNCENARANAEQQAEIAADLERWNWNSTPYEIATEIAEKDEHEQEAYRKAMDQMFKETEVDTVFDIVDCL